MLTLIAHISKPHGKNGDMIIRMNGYDADFIEPGEPVFVEINGTLVPFFITEITPKGDKATMHLRFIESVEEAMKISGCPVYYKTTGLPVASADKPEDLSFLAGYKISDRNTGMEGTILEFIDNPNNPLFLITTGEKEFLVPAHPKIIDSVDHSKQILFTIFPLGLDEI